jgi:NCK-associated protein 1
MFQLFSQPHQNSLILHAFMDLFCSFVRVNLFSDKVIMFVIALLLKCITILNNSFSSFTNLLSSLAFFLQVPRKMILQVYNILHVMLKGGRDCEFYHRYGRHGWKLEICFHPPKPLYHD